MSPGLKIRLDCEVVLSNLGKKEKKLEIAESEIINLTSKLKIEELKLSELLLKIDSIELYKDNIVQMEEKCTELQIQVCEKERHIKSLNEEIESLRRKLTAADERYALAEHNVRSMSTDSFSLDFKENITRSSNNLSKHDLEALLANSRPVSRRQGLSMLDSNQENFGKNSSQAPLSESSVNIHESCRKTLETVKMERDSAIANLEKLRISLSKSNKRKKEMEEAITKQLYKTQNVLSKTKPN